MAVFTSLNMSDDARHAIANGIFSAITNDMPELIQRRMLKSWLTGKLQTKGLDKNERNLVYGGNVSSGAFPNFRSAFSARDFQSKHILS